MEPGGGFTIRFAVGEKTKMSGLVASPTLEVGPNPGEKKQEKPIQVLAQLLSADRAGPQLGEEPRNLQT